MLTDPQKQQLDEEGYLALPGLVSPALLAELRERVEGLFAEEGEVATSFEP